MMNALFCLRCFLGRMRWHLLTLVTRPMSARCGECTEVFLGPTREVRVWMRDHECAGWLAQQTGDREVHVLPLGDLFQHAESEDCVCGPRADLRECGDGGDGWVYIHHSLDGRELTEPDREMGRPDR